MEPGANGVGGWDTAHRVARVTVFWLPSSISSRYLSILPYCAGILGPNTAAA